MPGKFGKTLAMLKRAIFAILRLTFFVLLIAALTRPITGCTKNSFHNNTDSTDTVFYPVHHDSAKFYVSMLMNVYKSSDVFEDTFSDDASMIIYVVDGVVKVPGDSILNFPPVVFPQSGSSGSWSATWIPDQIGEINIVGATGLVLPDDTTVVMTINQSGTVTPNWAISFMGGSPSNSGNEATPGWPLAFSFSLQQKSQDAFKLEQPGSYWDIWVYKDY